MDITWEINNNDINRLRDFVAQHQNPFVAYRIEKNINRTNFKVDKDLMLKSLIMCLLTSQQRSSPNSLIGIFLRQKPFPITEENILAQNDIQNFVRTTLLQNGLNRFINKIPTYFAANYHLLKASNWAIMNDLINSLSGQATKETERAIADNLDDTFIGFGPKQARNFLQASGLTKFEIPIDSRITDWLNDFGFPVTLSSKPLQDKGYYHFVSDGIQLLCDNVGIYPCILDAAIFSSFDNNEWTEENSIY